MNDPAFKTAASKLAEFTPEYLGQPTTPPISWELEGANLVVILADGRKVRGPIVDQYRDKVLLVSSTGKVVSEIKQIKLPAASLPVTVVAQVPVRKLVTSPPTLEKTVDKPLPIPPAKRIPTRRIK